MTRTFYIIQGFGANGSEFDLELEWTTKPPEQDGIYWAMYKGAPRIVELYYLIHGPLRANVIGMEISFGLSEFTHWLAPLPPPEPPQV